MLPPGGRSPLSTLSSSLPTATVSPLSSFHQTPVLNSPITSFQTTPMMESPLSLRLQAPRSTPTIEASPNLSACQSPVKFMLRSELQDIDDIKSKFSNEQGEFEKGDWLYVI